MAQKGKLMETPTVYEVGDDKDISEARWTELIMKVGDWLAETRKDVKEPNVLARQILEACLKGVKPSDPTTQWKGAERASFATRVRMAVRFDTDKLEGLRTKNERNTERKKREKERNAAKRRRAMDDTNIPNEIRKELAKSAKYGDDPRVFLSSAEAERWQELHDAYVKDFPELGGVNAAAELNLLCDLLVVSERQRMRVLQGEQVDPRAQGGVTDQIVALKRALNIHPEQLAKRVQAQTTGTVGELVKRMADMGDWAELREKFWMEELLMLFQMYHTPSPRENMGGYQLDEVGLFGQTRCRTCICPRCGSRNYVGVTIDEVEEYLVSKGVLELKSPVTALIEQAQPVAAVDISATLVEPDVG